MTLLFTYIKKNKLFFFILISIFIGSSIFLLQNTEFNKNYIKIYLPNSDNKINKDKSQLSTSNYSISTDILNLNFFKRYGSLDFINNELIYVDPDGIIYVLLKDNQLKVISKDTLNTNLDVFKANVDPSDVFMDGFAVKDSLYLQNIQTLFVSTIFYKPQEDCYLLSIFSKKLFKQGYNFINDDWVKIFDTNPCLKIFDTDPPFATASSGGRLASLSDNELLLSVGDYYHFEGGKYNDLSSKLSNDYGKILKINIIDNSKTIYSSGHRNPQGLAIKDNIIFSTEHGPEGGDELNKIINMGFYGFPLYSEGTTYGEKTWISKSVETRSQLKPFMSWTPAIGISNLIFLNNVQFPLWENNLLISSLRGKSLFRLKYDNDKVYFIEEIPVGYRIRDIVQNQLNGDIYLLTDPQGSRETTNIIKMKIKK
jgi:hypothetical protein